ncbi:MAG: stage III sporulation protein AF [Hungatella sp.]
MDWKQKMLKFNWKGGMDKWLLLLAFGVLLLIVAFPSGSSGGWMSAKTTAGKKTAGKGNEAERAEAAEASAKAEKPYEQQLEERVKELLRRVEGVGAVDVMIVLKSSEEKVLRVDVNSSSSSTMETDSNGGNRKVEEKEVSEDTILSGSGDSGTPIIEKELRPEIAGVVISAVGGGSPQIKAEISEAMEALLDVPPHKIKVLKRAE